jgi:hypothetical protein
MAARKNSETTTDGTVTISDVTLDNTVGPALFSRDEHGLLGNVQYTFNEDGSVNWRAMIGDEHLFPNRGWFEGRGKDVPRTAQGLGDHQLLIKLSGIKELAKLRGFSDLSYDAVKCELDHVAVICRMTFMPNYETCGNPIEFQDMANASFENTSSFATKFLETIACNRAFVRCVRNFLNVHIVGDDEIDKSGKPSTIGTNSSPLSPHGVLEKRFGTFDEFKNILRDLWSSGQYKNETVKEWGDFSDIPPKEARILIGLTKES